MLNTLATLNKRWTVKLKEGIDMGDHVTVLQFQVNRLEGVKLPLPELMKVAALISSLSEICEYSTVVRSMSAL